MAPSGAGGHTSRFLARDARKDLLRFASVGAAGDGKSTLIGQLLHHAESRCEDQPTSLKAHSALVGSGPESDVTYRHFSTPRRNFIVADTPGHEHFTPDMVAGASTANLALVLIDARHGPLVQTKRHSFIAALLGIPRLLIAVNKMDLVGYSREAFDRITGEYTDFASRLGVVDLKFIPVSALHGDNLVERSPNTPWYTGDPVLGYLENVYIGSDRNLVDLRLPVQYVLRPPQGGRSYAGQIGSGILKKGEEILVLPAMKTTRVRSILGPEGEHDHAFAPMSVAVTLEDEIDISRGDLLVHPRNVPSARSIFEAMLIWMAAEPMRLARRYLVKHTTRLSDAVIQRVDYRVDVNTLSRAPAHALELNEIGRVVFQTSQKLFLDPYQRNRLTGSFIVVDPMSNGTVAAGMVIERLSESQLRAPTDGLAAPKSENIRAEVSPVSAADREGLLGQRAVTIWFTGLSGSGKSSIAQELARRLHEERCHVYILDGDNLRFGLNRDLGFSKGDRAENIRRAAEVARLFNDAGTIALVPVISPFRDDREGARRIIGPDRFLEIYVSTPLEVCEARDAKGLYRRARAGEVVEFTGISSPYEPPGSPFLTVDTTGQTVHQTVEDVLESVRPKLRAVP